MSTTDSNGSIESLIGSIIEPQTSEEINTDSAETETETESQDEVEEEVDESEVTDDATEEEAPEEIDDSQDNQDAEEADTEEPTYTVTVDGTEREVTLSELKRGFSGQEYVQKGMREAAAQRKQAEEVYAALLNERQQLAALYQQMQQGNIASPPQPPSREMFDSDPIGYMEAKLNYDEKMVEFNNQQAGMRQVYEQQSKAEQAARQAYIQRELESLKGVIPEFGDPKQATQVRDQMFEAGKYYGYTPEDISQAIDHRALHVLRDAMKYRQLQEGRKAADKKVAKKPPIKAGSKRIVDSVSKQRAVQRDRLKQTGRMEDALSLLLKPN